MLLVNSVIVVAKLVDEYVQKHESASLRLREPANDTIRPAVVRNIEPFKDLPMCIEIRQAQLHPKVLRPGMEINRSAFLATVKLVMPVAMFAVGRHDNALQSL